MPKTVQDLIQMRHVSINEWGFNRLTIQKLGMEPWTLEKLIRARVRPPKFLSRYFTKNHEAQKCAKYVFHLCFFSTLTYDIYAESESECAHVSIAKAGGVAQWNHQLLFS